MLETRLAARPVALLMIDVDRFKDFNDRHGHPAGDALLRKLAGVLAAELRNSDMLARYGGEEFAALLHDVDAASAEAMGERLRRAVAASCRDPTDGISITVSIGIAVATNPTDHDRLLEEADRALYEGKRAGRDRVVKFKGRARPEGIGRGLRRRLDACSLLSCSGFRPLRSHDGRRCPGADYLAPTRRSGMAAAARTAIQDGACRRGRAAGEPVPCALHRLRAGGNGGA